MIELTSTFSSATPTVIRVIGIGNAGSNAIDRILLDGLENVEALIMNTDQQALTHSVVRQQLQLGRNTTHGLGSGGDPEMGLDAARESIEEIRAVVENAGMVILCAGLGGGTGSGCAPVVARVAKDEQALVVAFATMPFGFEGRRRRKQAEESLEALRQIADVVICFENDRMSEGVSPRAGAHQAFAAADQTISQSVVAICGLLRKRGLVRIGFDELRVALGTISAPAVFGFGMAEGENRAHEALERALKSPLMERGKLLENAHNVLVQVAGGQDMTMAEVQVMMEALNRYVGEETQILFGLSVDGKMGKTMSITLLSAPSLGLARGGALEAIPPRPMSATPPIEAREPVTTESWTEEEASIEEEDLVEAETAVTDFEADEFEDEAVEPEEVFAEATVHMDETLLGDAMPAQEKPKPPVEHQENLVFEPVNRGRFEKSEPTIINGEDLDVPTFLRRNVRIK